MDTDELGQMIHGGPFTELQQDLALLIQTHLQDELGIRFISDTLILEPILYFVQRYNRLSDGLKCGNITPDEHKRKLRILYTRTTHEVLIRVRDGYRFPDQRSEKVDLSFILSAYPTNREYFYRRKVIAGTPEGSRLGLTKSEIDTVARIYENRSQEDYVDILRILGKHLIRTTEGLTRLGVDLSEKVTEHKAMEDEKGYGF